MPPKTPSRATPRWPLALAAASLTALAGCSAGPPQDLRGPGPQKGQVLRTEIKAELTNGKLVMQANGRRLEGSCGMAITHVAEHKILEVVGRRATRVETTFITDDNAGSMNVGALRQQNTAHGVLTGHTVRRELLRGRWTNTLVAAVPTAKQRKELDFLPGFESEDALYPEGKTKPGRTWKIDPLLLRKFLGPRCSYLSGTASLTFEKTTTLDGESCAQLKLALDVKGGLQDSEARELNIEFKGEGDVYRSLKSGYDVRSTLSGTVKVMGTVSERGQSVQLEFGGPMEIEEVTKLK